MAVNLLRCGHRVLAHVDSAFDEDDRAQERSMAFAATAHSGGSWHSDRAKAAKRRVKPLLSRAPGNAELGEFAVGGAGHARDIGMQPSLKLEEVQVLPVSADPVVVALIGMIAVGAEQARD